MAGSDIVVILVHGYNVSNPERTVGKFRQYMEAEGALVENFVYGYLPFPWQISRRNPKLAEKLARRAERWAAKGYRVFVAAHSNGCAIAQLACQDHEAPIERLLAVHPALRQDMDPAPGAERIYVIYNKGDGAVVAGRFLGRISKYLAPWLKSWQFRPWGKMGKYGYRGEPDERIDNYDTHDTRYFIPNAWGHSAEFKNGKAQKILPMLSRLLVHDRPIIRAGDVLRMPQ